MTEKPASPILPRFSDSEIQRIAGRVARVAESTGLGFVLARVVTDQIIEGTLSPDDPRFETDLEARALELLLGGAGEARRSDRAMLIALALAPSGLPLGRVWTAAAVAVDEGCNASEEEQVGLVVRLSRFLIEERKGAQVRYRVFHEALRVPLQRAPLDPGGEPLDEGEVGNRAARVCESLAQLVLAQTERWQWPGQADPYLVDTLPTLLAARAEHSLIARVTDGAPSEMRRPYARALLEEAADALAIGDSSRALSQAQWAGLVVGQAADDDPLFVDSQLAMCDALIAMDYPWRDARDIARGELDRAWGRAQNGLDDPVHVGQVVRAARRLVRALGIGAFDAEEGLEILEDTLERLSAAPASALAPNGEHVADLLISYSDSLRSLNHPAARVAPLEGAVLLLQGQVDAGRVDLKLNLSNAIAHLAITLDALGRSEGLELLRQSVSEMAAFAPFSPAHMRQVTPVVGELVQHLGMTGLHAEALEWLDWAIEAYRPAADVDSLSAEDLVTALLMRAAVLAALSRDDDALSAARDAMNRCVEGDRARTIASRTLVLRLLDLGRYDEALDLADREPPDSSYYAAPGSPWWADVARANLLTAAGNPAEAITILENHLSRMGRPAWRERPGISFENFINFEPSLRTGAALADAHEAMGQETPASDVLARAALIFQEQRLPRSPRALLHVPAHILDRYAVGFFGPPPNPTAHEIHEWTEALHALSHGGRHALEKIAATGLAPVDVNLRLSAKGAQATSLAAVLSRATSRSLDPAHPWEENKAVRQLVQKSLAAPSGQLVR